MATKVNPRKKPATAADLKKAADVGFNNGICGALTIMLYTLKDKFGTTDEELKEFADAFNYTLDSINKGYVKLKDLQKVISEEYGIDIVLE